MTPEEQREDMRSMEGDPVLRVATPAARPVLDGDPGEILAGASLVLTGSAGLTLVLGGRPAAAPRLDPHDRPGDFGRGSAARPRSAGSP